MLVTMIKTRLTPHKDRPESQHRLTKFTRILQAHLPELRKKYHVKSLGIFGSYVRGEQSTTSDLDLLVEFSEPPSLFEFVALRDHLSELLGVEVDLVMRSALKPAVRKQILSEVVPV